MLSPLKAGSTIPRTTACSISSPCWKPFSMSLMYERSWRYEEEKWKRLKWTPLVIEHVDDVMPVVLPSVL